MYNNSNSNKDNSNVENKKKTHTKIIIIYADFNAVIWKRQFRVPSHTHTEIYIYLCLSIYVCITKNIDMHKFTYVKQQTKKLKPQIRIRGYSSSLFPFFLGFFHTLPTLRMVSRGVCIVSQNVCNIKNIKYIFLYSGFLFEGRYLRYYKSVTYQIYPVDCISYVVQVIFKCFVPSRPMKI